VIHTDRIKQLAERDSNIAQVDLVISDPDVVIWVSVDNKDFDIARPRANLIEFARGTDGCPQSSKTGAKDQNAHHRFSPNTRCQIDASSSRDHKQHTKHAEVQIDRFRT
jgi:hypothetical protein